MLRTHTHTQTSHKRKPKRIHNLDSGLAEVSVTSDSKKY